MSRPMKHHGQWQFGTDRAFVTKRSFVDRRWSGLALDKREFPLSERPDPATHFRLVRFKERLLFRKGHDDNLSVAFFDPGGPADWDADSVEVLGSGIMAGREIPVYLCAPGATISWQRQYYPFKKYQARWNGQSWSVKEV